MRRLLPIGLLTILMAVSSWGNDDAAFIDSLLLQSIGGPEALAAVQEITQYQMFGDARVSGLEGEFIYCFTGPVTARTILDLNGLRMIQGVDGDSAWTVDFNGQRSEMSGFEREQLIESMYLQAFAHLQPDRYEVDRWLMYRDDEGIHEIGVRFGDGDTLRLGIDARSEMLVELVSRHDNLTSIMHFSDFDTINGVVWPRVTRAEVTGTPIEWEMSVDSIVFDRGCEEADAAQPEASPVPWPDGVDWIAVPMSLVDGHLHFPASVNGKRLSFILDSGAGANVLNAGSTDDDEFESVGTLPGRGVTGFQDIDLVQVESFAVGDLTFTDQAFGRLDFDALGLRGSRGLPLGGIVGQDLIARYPILVDYPSGELVFFKPDSFEPPPGGIEVPLQTMMEIPTIEATVAGRTGRFLIDLGNARELVLHSPFVEGTALEEEFRRSGRRGSFGGVGGRVDARILYLDSIMIGGVELTGVETLTGEAELGMIGSRDIAGNIGNGLFQRFTLLLDYPGRRLILYELTPSIPDR